MAYGTVKADSITFTSNSADVTTTLSGIYASTTNNLTLTGTASAVTFTGTTANFVSGVFSTQVSGATVIAPTGTFTSLTGTTATFTSGIIASGTAALPSLAILSDPNTGIFSPGADQLAVATNGTGKLFVDANGSIGVGTSSPTSYGSGITTGSLNGSAGSITDFYFNGVRQGLVGTFASNEMLIDTAGAAIPLKLQTNSAERARIRADGTFEIKGAGTAGTSPGFSVNPSTPANSFVIDSSGRLGIGTSAPSAQFVVGSGNTLLGHNTLDNYGGRVDIRSAYSARAANVPAQLFVADSAGSQLINTGGAIDLGGYQDQFSRAYSYARIQGLATSSSGLGGYLSFTVLNGGGSLTERVRIDTAGNVGIGTTSPAYALDVASSVAQVGNSTDAFIHYKSTAGNWHVGANSSNAYVFYSGTYGSGNERARIDSSGRLLVGTSTARASANGVSAGLQVEGLGAEGALSIIRNGGLAYLTLGRSGGASIGSNTAISNNDELGRISWAAADGTDIQSWAAQISAEIDGTPGSNDTPGRLVFSTTADGASSPTERMRINNVGSVAFFPSDTSGITGVYVGAAGAAGTSQLLFQGAYSASGIFGGILSFKVFTNGNVENTNNSYLGISDAKLKENIIHANSQWNDLKALQVRNYNFKEGQTHTQIGLVAQEVELVSPGLVNESPDRDEDGNDLGTVTKSVNYSVLYMKAVKALQEAMERIETLEQRLTAAGID